MSRDVVVWMGPTPPTSVLNAFGARGLGLIEEVDPRRAIALAQHTARAVVVHTRQFANLADTLVEIVGPARDAGSLVVLVAEDRERTHLAAIIAAQGAVGKQFASGKPALHVLSEPDVGVRLAEEMQRYDPGPGLDTAPRLEPEAFVGALEPSHRCLLERALHGMSLAEISKLGEGMTDAKVFRIHGHDMQGRRLAPLVAKLDRVDRIQQEILNTETFVAPFMPPRVYAPLVPARCVRGANDAVLIGNFLAGARSLDDYLGTCDKPGAAITALFDGPLEPWRQNARVERIHLGRAYRDWGVIQRNPQHIDEAHRRTVAQGHQVLLPDQVLAIVDAFPAVRVRTRITHGDLQARNIFVIDGPHLLLIDFFSTHHEACMSRDSATLDVTMAFDRRAGLDDAAIAALYRFPVMDAATDVFGNKWAAAIAQVRAQTTRDGVTPWEYDVSITLQLLRMARLGVQYNTLDDSRIALAYRLGSALAESLDGHAPPASIL